MESVCRGNPPTVGSNPTLSAKIPHPLHFGGGSGLRALRGSRRSGHESRSLRQIPHPLHFGGGSGLRALRGSRRSGHESRSLRQIPHPLHFGGGSGLRALRGSRRSGHESRSLRQIPHPLHFGGGSGLRALRGSRRSGHESRGLRGFRCSGAHAASGTNPGTSGAPGLSLLRGPIRLIELRGRRTLGFPRVVTGRAAARNLCNFSLRTASGPEGSSAK